MAMALLATAFIPIIGVMGSSAKATDKDDRNIRAVNICQEKLNQALQFPFGILEPEPRQTATYGEAGEETLESSADDNKISLKVGPCNINGFEFDAVLTVADRPGTFQVPMYDPFKKADPAFKDNPDLWGWDTQSKDYEGMLFQYTMKVTWKDKGDAREKEYVLSTFKSKVRD